MRFIPHDRLLHGYLHVLALLFLVGAVLHIGDLLGFRLQARLGMGDHQTFSHMPAMEQATTIFLAVFDTAVVIGLWRLQAWGVVCFLLVSLSELIAFGGFPDYFHDQDLLHLMWFHLVTIGIYVILMAMGNFLNEPIRENKDSPF